MKSLRTTITRWVRRHTRCRRNEHRDTLRMVPWVMMPPMTIVVHRLSWRCVDCGRDDYLALSDNIDEERKAGRHV